MADDDTGVPTDVVETVESVASRVEEVESLLRHTLDACDVDVLAELPPLDRAHTFLTLAKAVSALYTLQLRCKGECIEDHEVKSELDRLQLYTDKVEYYIDRTTAKPTASINPQAAARFIEHSLPDLTPNQRHDMREISRGVVASGIRYRDVSKKRRHEKPAKRSVASEAAAFLEKARMELLGVNMSKLHENLEKEDSDSENKQSDN